GVEVLAEESRLKSDKRTRSKPAPVPPHSPATPAALAVLPDDELLNAVQRQTFRFFWEGSHPGSGLAPDRRRIREHAGHDKVAIGGSGFGVMALIVAAERGWVSRDAAVERLG